MKKPTHVHRYKFPELPVDGSFTGKCKCGQTQTCLADGGLNIGWKALNAQKAARKKALAQTR